MVTYIDDAQKVAGWIDMNANGDFPEEPGIKREIHCAEINQEFGLVVTFKNKVHADRFLERLAQLGLMQPEEFVPVSRPQLHYKGGETGRQEVHIPYHYTDKMPAIAALLTTEFTLPSEAQTAINSFLRKRAVMAVNA